LIASSGYFALTKGKEDRRATRRRAAGPEPEQARTMRTRIIGQRFIELASVDSTNNLAADLLASGETVHGTVILAHEQTAGRGQRGRSWLSAPGLDIATSVVLRLDAWPVQHQFDLAKVAALATHDVVTYAMRSDVHGSAAEVRIKWPNDILVDRRKVAGILIKNEVLGGLITGAVIGIGINVNSTELDAGLNATSIHLETGRLHDRMALLELLCQRLEHWLDAMLRHEAVLADRYRALLWSRDRFARFDLDGASVDARPLDVDPQGRLLVEMADGRVQAYGLDRLRFADRS
jgi:BirA family biotin operon repressor/biotin-[acetyl-CoA-carboxylase] ligase